MATTGLSTQKERLKHWREKIKGYETSRAFAKAAQIDESNYYKYESTDSTPKPEVLIILQREGLDLNWYFTGEGGLKEAREIKNDKSRNFDSTKFITYVPDHSVNALTHEYPNANYMQQLPRFSLPPDYRLTDAIALKVDDDMMSSTLNISDIVFGEKVERFEWISPRKVHILIAERGVFIRRFLYHRRPALKDSFFEWQVDNPFYNDIALEHRIIPAMEVKGIYKGISFIPSTIPAPDETKRLMAESLKVMKDMMSQIATGKPLRTKAG